VYQKQLSPSAKVQAEETKKIDASSLQEGDLVFFNIDAGRISHVGIYLQNNKFVHASTKRGVVINDLNEPYYKKYFVRSGRVK
jgi:lipoprotein Spr